MQKAHALDRGVERKKDAIVLAFEVWETGAGASAAVCVLHCCCCGAGAGGVVWYE